MSLEDEIRETMRAHDAEAPSAHGLVMPGQHSRRTRWLAPVAAAAVVVAVAGGWFAADQLTGSSHKAPVAGSTDECPTAYPSNNTYWVPSKPSVAGADDRLVPDVTPESMQVCAYLHEDNGQLTGQQAVTSNLSAAAQTLTWLPRNMGSHPCALYYAVTDGDNYLIELSYPDGVIWLGAPGNHCSGASNGDFETRANLRQFAADAYSVGAWRPPGLDQPPTTCGYKWAPGRLGDDKVMVPGAPESVTICSDGRSQTTVNPSALVAELNALPTQPSTGCHPTHDPNFTMIDYYLYFNYAEGPPAVVDVVVGCTPNVDNSALQAQADQQLVELIQQMLG